MAKIILSYVAIFCLLILASANNITTSLNKTFVTECGADLADESKDQPISPLEEDTTGEDDETSKLIPHLTHHPLEGLLNKHQQGNHLLASFHFLEINSPPPQA